MSARCSECGTRIAGSYVSFCPSCGSFLDWQDGNEQEAQHARAQGSASSGDGAALALRVDVAPATLTVDPGSVADAEITVHNDGTRVEDVVVEATVEGASVPWLRVQPTTVSIYPETDARISLEAAPPRRSDRVAGITPFQIHVQSSLDPRVRAGTGGSLVIGAFHELATILSPDRVNARRHARSWITITNDGNVTENVELSGAGQGRCASQYRAPSLSPLAPASTYRCESQRRCAGSAAPWIEPSPSTSAPMD